MTANERIDNNQAFSWLAFLLRCGGVLIKHPTIFITLMTATLFYGGYVYNAAYLSGLGVEETQFSISLDRMLFQGFMSGVDTLIKFILPFVAGSVFYFLLCLALNITAERFPEQLSKVGEVFGKLRDKFPKHKTPTVKQQQPPLISSGTVVTSFAIAVSSILSLYFLILVVMTYYFSNEAGKEAAKTFIENCASGKYQKTGIFMSGMRVSEGCSIICNSGECAYLFANQTTKIIDRQGKTISEREAGKFK